MERSCDFLVIGSGLAGLAFALKMADFGRVVILAKGEAPQTNTSMAQGGIAAVLGAEDSFEQHVQDTLKAGAGLCHEATVRSVVEQAPERIQDLINWGVQFDFKEGQGATIDLTREGGHTQRRIAHVQDHTGLDIQRALLAQVQAHPQIEIVEKEYAIDLITNRKVAPAAVDPLHCLGAYALNAVSGEVHTWLARATILATGGAGKTYLYTSNWEGATGDGIAMAFRAGARVMNMEFMQFHPTCLYHPQTRNFLITEAMRGEGAELVNSAGEAFMKRYDPRGSLAPRDIVARSIDREMKTTAAECVYLDITHKPAEFVSRRFPVIYKKCFDLGIDITREPIPVVPAAHYLCGGVLTDATGRTDIEGLFAIGETGCTGLHGANRLASNSLLECLAFAHNASHFIRRHLDAFPMPLQSAPPWIYTNQENADEMVVISHMWDEIRRLMWNYVGIVRSDRRLARAHSRLRNIINEVHEYYWNFKLHPDVLELRNIALVAELTVRCALHRKESRGIHYNIDYGHQNLEPAQDTILSPTFRL